MRKNNEGYVLPFVLVVMIVLTIITTSLMTAALRNLQSQQKFMERMVDKYQAEGEIEKIVAQLDGIVEVTGYTDSDIKELLEPKVKQLCNAVNAKVTVSSVSEEQDSDVQVISGDGTETGDNTGNDDKDNPEEKAFEYSFELTCPSVSGATEIHATILLSGKIVQDQVASNPDLTLKRTEATYIISEHKITYQSYEISTKEVPAE